MAKARKRHICQECGYGSANWLGKCPSCGFWDTFVEEVVQGSTPAKSRKVNKPVPMTSISMGDHPRIITGVGEIDRVMGGGITRGSTTLVAGDPGIGKSTLMTELGRDLSNSTVLYVTGEESAQQVRMRAERLDAVTDNVLLLAESSLENIIRAALDTTPDVIIVDSIQTVHSEEVQSAPGSVSQVRECAATIMRATQDIGASTFLVGHVTKSGMIAGPRVLEHMMDTVLYFEGERHHSYRVLRAMKNRFGSTNEIGIFEMVHTGLREVTNPSEIFLSERRGGQSGSTVVCSIEGTRPVLVEVQALASPTSYGVAQRTANGFDQRRLQLLLAVLEKRQGLSLGDHDVFVNVAGGVRLEEPATDLGVAVAVASSLYDSPADECGVLIGEVGLGGEVRSISKLDVRLGESFKLGFTRAVVPQSSLKGLNTPSGLEVVGINFLGEVLELLG